MSSVGKKTQKDSETISLSTEKYGKIKIEKENIIIFVNGILGFEELRQFVIVNAVECRPFELLVSVENPMVAFPVINPIPLFIDYNPLKLVPASDLAPLKIKGEKDAEAFCIVTLGNRPEDVTVNLKGPILVNMQNRRGKQFVLADERYSLTQPLIRKQKV